MQAEPTKVQAKRRDKELGLKWMSAIMIGKELNKFFRLELMME